ncbi:hypothetical protein [Streptosporangium sp. NPDC048865]|uniref:hypothetical protein n=1 Tax=Streptosporangium sp. NPDC048865 TaxID=3155766 RepID=UPI00343455FE
MPDYLAPVLRQWLINLLSTQEGLATSLQLRLRRQVFATRIHPQDRPKLAFQGNELLEAVDAILAINAHFIETTNPALAQEREEWPDHVGVLGFRLTEAGSAWKINDDLDGLERRVDETAAAAARSTIAAAPPDASAHLKAAWSTAYGFHPDPEKAYSQAIKAAEAVVIPATIPNAGTPTLGTALKHLEDTKAKWTTVLDDKNGNPASAEPIIGLIRMLWQGQRDRHAGGPTSKPTTQEAAEAAVHAAVLIVQWFNSRAVVKNP